MQLWDELWKFQSLIGRLQTRADGSVRVLWLEFQSLIGRLQTH